MANGFTDKQKAIIAIAAFTASGDIEQLKPNLVKGLEVGLTVNEIKEVLVQMYAYTGFPRSLNGLGAFMAIVNERKEQGIKDVEGEEASPIKTYKTSLEFGTENQTQLIGTKVAGPLFDFAPAIDEYLKAHLFGDIFARDVLTWKDREIATIAALANLKGAGSQLGSHYFISMNNGVTPENLQEFVEILRDICDADVADAAQAVLDKTLEAVQ